MCGWESEILGSDPNSSAYWDTTSVSPFEKQGNNSNDIMVVNRPCVHAKSLRRVPSFATLQTIAHQAPLSIGFSRQEYWSGLPSPLQVVFLTQGSNLYLLCLLHWQVGSLLIDLGCLFYAQPCTVLLTWTILCISHNHPRKWLLVSLFCRWGNWILERLPGPLPHS